MCGNAAKIMAARRRKAASASWHCRRRKKRASGIGVKALGSSAWRNNGENGDISESNQRRQPAAAMAAIGGDIIGGG
jgi:hypothetical protein